MQNILTFLFLFLFIEGIAWVYGRLELKMVPGHSTVKPDRETISTLYHSKMGSGLYLLISSKSS